MKTDSKKILFLLVSPFLLTFVMMEKDVYRAKNLDYFPSDRFSVDVDGVLNVWGNGQRNGVWINVPLKLQTTSIRFLAKNISRGNAEFPRVGLVIGSSVVDSVIVSSPIFSWYRLIVPSGSEGTAKLTFLNDAYNDLIDVNFAIDSVEVIYIKSMMDTLRGKAVKISWKPNTEPDLAGYKLYYGNQSRSYIFVRDDIGTDTLAVVRPDYFKEWYIAVTAYDTAGNESGYSNEVSFYWLPPDTIKKDTIPPKPPVILKLDEIDRIIIYFK